MHVALWAAGPGHSSMGQCKRKWANGKRNPVKERGGRGWLRGHPFRPQGRDHRIVAPALPEHSWSCGASGGLSGGGSASASGRGCRRCRRPRHSATAGAPKPPSRAPRGQQRQTCVGAQTRQSCTWGMWRWQATLSQQSGGTLPLRMAQPRGDRSRCGSASRQHSSLLLLLALAAAAPGLLRLSVIALLEAAACGHGLAQRSKGTVFGGRGGSQEGSKGCGARQRGER